MKRILSLLVLFILISTLSVSAYNTTDIESTNLPPYFSWQDIEGIDYTTPIKDQTPAPTCEAYALCASLETIMQYQTQDLYNPDLSETHLYFYAGGTYEAGYVNLVDAANYLIDYGVPDEGCYPDPHRAFDYPFESLPGWENRTVKITEWGWIDHDIESIKSALIEHGPLVVCMYLYKDFFYYLGGVYEHKWGRIAGGHVMTIVGYDDVHECWIIKNSWGSFWGEDGWLRISYHEDVIADWYGEGTGVMYIDGIYGNLKPDVPKIYVTAPDNFNTYFFGREFRTLFKKLPIQKSSPRIFGKLTVTVDTQNTDYVEFYINDELVCSDNKEPFTWELQVSRGIHTLKVKAYKYQNASIDIVDLFKF